MCNFLFNLSLCFKDFIIAWVTQFDLLCLESVFLFNVSMLPYTMFMFVLGLVLWDGSNLPAMLLVVNSYSRLLKAFRFCFITFINFGGDSWRLL